MFWKIFAILNWFLSFFFRGMFHKKIRYIGINLTIKITILIWCIDFLGWTLSSLDWIWCWSGIFKYSFLYIPVVIIWAYGLFGIIFLSICFISNKWWRLPYVKDLFYSIRNEMNHFSEYNTISNSASVSNICTSSQVNNNS